MQSHPKYTYSISLLEDLSAELNQNRFLLPMKLQSSSAELCKYRGLFSSLEFPGYTGYPFYYIIDNEPHRVFVTWDKYIRIITIAIRFMPMLREHIGVFRSRARLPGCKGDARFSGCSCWCYLSLVGRPQMTILNGRGNYRQLMQHRSKTVKCMFQSKR